MNVSVLFISETCDYICHRTLENTSWLVECFVVKRLAWMIVFSSKWPLMCPTKERDRIASVRAWWSLIWSEGEEWTESFNWYGPQLLVHEGCKLPDPCSVHVATQHTDRLVLVAMHRGCHQDLLHLVLVILLTLHLLSHFYSFTAVYKYWWNCAIVPN